MTSEKIIDILKNGKIHLSCELFPPKQGAELQNSLEIVNKIAASTPSYMSVTYGAGGSTVGYSAALAKKVEDNGMPALAHLTCVKADEAKLAEVLGQLQGFGVKNILALRGDIPADMQGEEIGSFAHASELMRFVKQQGDFCVGGAAYPEGHPESGSLEKDIENTKYKVDAGVDFLVTQMFFDNAKYFAFVERCRQEGITVPIIPGIKPVVFKNQLTVLPKIFRSDIPEPFARELRKCKDDAEAKEVGVEWCIQQCKELIAHGVPSLHFYTMMASDSVYRVAKEIY